MKKIFYCIFCCLLITGMNIANAEDISTMSVHSMNDIPYLPPITPQPMYGLSGQQFMPQINITGSSSGVKFDNPYYEKADTTKDEIEKNIKEPQDIPVNNPYEQNDFSPIYIK